MSQYIHIEAEEIKRVTDKALLAVIDGDEYWLPLSQIADSDDYEGGETDVTLSITEWIAKEKGLGG